MGSFPEQQLVIKPKLNAGQAKLCKFRKSATFQKKDWRFGVSFYEPILENLEGMRLKGKIPSVGGMDIFWIYTFLSNQHFNYFWCEIIIFEIMLCIDSTFCCFLRAICNILHLYPDVTTNTDSFLHTFMYLKLSEFQWKKVQEIVKHT